LSSIGEVAVGKVIVGVVIFGDPHPFKTTPYLANKEISSIFIE
jgi:hypothetical protein